MNAHPQLPSPGGYQQAYSQSCDLAFNALAKADLEAIYHHSGAKHLSNSSIILSFLGDDVIIDVPKRTVTSAKTALAMTDQLVILHYLIATPGTTCSDQLVSFKELPGGLVYYPTFYKRALAPIVKRFGPSPAELCAVAATYFDGKPISLGDAATIIQALPRVRLTWVLWRGDEDFPAEPTLLFDSTINDYLPLEDIVVLCQSVAMRLCR